MYTMQQTVQAAASVLASLPLQCHLTLFWEQTEHSSSSFASAVEDFRKQVWASRRPVQMMMLDRTVLKTEATWKRSVCDAYVLVLGEGRELVRHADDPATSISSRLWNYKGHYIMLLLGSLGPARAAGLSAVSKTANLLMVQPLGVSVLVWTPRMFPRYSPPRLLHSWRNKGLRYERLRYTPKDNDLWNSVLRVATFDHPPSVVYDYDSLGRVVRRLGVDMQLIETLAKARNFTLEFHEVSHEELWGYELENGTWVGLVGQVHHERVDLGTCNLFLETHRAQLLDYSTPYNFERGCFVTPSPKPLNNWQSPTLPFAWSTWVATFASLALGGALLRLVVAFSSVQEPREFTSFSFAYLYVMGSLTSRTLNLTPHGPRLRAYVGLVWLTALILATAYSANLVAFLSVTQMSVPINTLRQLAGSGLRLGGHAFWKTQFRASIDPTVQSFADRLEPHVDLDALFEQVAAGKFALIENRQYLETVAAVRNSRGRSVLRIMPQCLLTYSIGLAFPQNSPLSDFLNPLILRVVEAGLVFRWRRDVVDYYRSQSADTSSGQDLVLSSRGMALNLNQLQGAFYVLVLGCFGACIVFLLEQLNSPRPS
ncbi:hypothetical protein O3P69_002429 [Scylla paramamosain]|uniref:Uncharacterized protein n=1 Tax=Scylla paramamosain TaxID=85552 RepID=A0AAW0V800_SCYPA